MATSSSSSPGNRKAPTLRLLAESAGVTSMTVSLALRNHPRIPPATRTRIQKLAADHGYRPDPVVAKLMNHLRTRRTQRVQTTLCGLQLRPVSPLLAYDYTAEVTRGAKRRAESLGFGFEVMMIDEPNMTPKRLQRILVSRGVDGLVLLPSIGPGNLSALLDWSLFATVSTTYSVLSPHVHTVVPDQFANMMLLCEQLSAQGCRRLGYVTTRQQDLRVKHHGTAAVYWHQNQAITGNVAVPPLVVERLPSSLPALVAWVAAYEPDAVITDSEFDIDLLAPALSSRARRRIRWATTSTLPPVADFPGVNEKPDEVGEAAIELVVAMVNRGERGLPASPRTTLIEGVYFAPKRGGKGALSGSRPIPSAL